ncbi:hypothetical protein Tco_0502520 [Tanacetum coccineum]
MVGKLSHETLQRKRVDKSHATYKTLMTHSTFKSSTNKLAWQIIDWGDMMRKANLSKDISGLESPPELQRSWRRWTKLRRNQDDPDIHYR